MKTISRYLMTLALLLTAVTGAWADETPLVTIENKDNASFKSGSKTFDDKVTVTFSNEVNNDGDTDGWYTYGESLLTVAGINGYTITSCKFYTDNGTAANGYTVEGESPSVYISSNQVYTNNSEPVNIGGRGITKIEVYGGVASAEPAIEVTTNAASEQDLFTEASFTMPASDVTVNYELVRDMSVQMQAQVGDDPAKEPRYRVQRNGESWVPADLEYEEVMALFSVNDLIENNTTLDPQNYLVSIYAVDDEGQPTGDAMNFKTFTFAPGRYCVTASAQLDAPYEGTTAPSNIFELFQGYEVTVGAGEYATFYKDENLYTEDEDAELYTISSVSDTEAVLSDKLAMVAANTPMLVYNKGTEAKTFILLPTEKDADEVTVAKEFRGTLAEKEMPASSPTVDYYVCTGKAFEWVRDAGVIAANKCWLQIGEQPAAARAMTRSIVGGGNTTNMDDVRWQMEDGNYYDLQGRKVEKPNRKGIYIHNGKKVIVR